jgi:hypothetical protein
VHISGERQLDGRGLPAFFLFVLLVERIAVGGTTVPIVIDAIRAQLGDGVAKTLFEEKLIACGYHDAQRSRYDEKIFLIKGHSVYQVTDAFPKLISPLPNGVGDLSYTIALSACKEFATEDNDLISLISGSTFTYDA